VIDGDGDDGGSSSGVGGEKGVKKEWNQGWSCPLTHTWSLK